MFIPQLIQKVTKEFHNDLSWFSIDLITKKRLASMRVTISRLTLTSYRIWVMYKGYP